ncbi:MAG: imidazole glycerol phosphate synthase subunit HisH [Chloroflexia bacterium]|nr:imidazole glycerol phosphate synthase subunit HisH [Chloroflexia bacterium]
MIVIINYGSGNIQAIANIYHKLNIPHIISDKIEDLKRASKLVLPGVGAFDEVMNQLNESGLRETLDEMVLVKKTPVIGVCVGMQILAKSSEEGIVAGLGWIDGTVKKVNVKNLTHKPHLPHMGWNVARPSRQNPVIEGLDLDKGFYFLHSFCFHCHNPNDALMTTEYGETIISAVNHENVYGMQFHPEKSHNNGIQIFKNFANL